VFPIENKCASWGGSKAASPSTQQPSLLPAHSSPAIAAALQASKSQMSMPPYTETNISPRGKKNMCVDFYAPVQIKKKMFVPEKKNWL